MRDKARILFLFGCSLSSALLLFALIFSYMERKNHIKASDFDPEIRKAGVLIRAICPHFSLFAMKLINRFMLLFFPKSFRSKGLLVKTIFLERDDGSMLRMLEVKRKAQESKKGLLYLHGGGYAFGSPVQDRKKIKRLVLECDSVVYAPFYTLSVQKPFPAAIDDCYLALKYVSSHGYEKLSVCGVSAGGGLAASLSQMAKDRGEIKLALLMLLYPMLDDRFTPTSRANDAPIWNTKSNINAWKLYLGDYYQKEEIPPYAAPGRRDDLSLLPETICYIGSLDPFLFETECYMRRLEECAVKVHYKVYTGAFHAFDMFRGSKLAQEALSFMYESYNEITGN